MSEIDDYADPGLARRRHPLKVAALSVVGCAGLLFLIAVTFLAGYQLGYYEGFRDGEISIRNG